MVRFSKIPFFFVSQRKRMFLESSARQGTNTAKQQRTKTENFLQKKVPLNLLFSGRNHLYNILIIETTASGNSFVKKSNTRIT